MGAIFYDDLVMNKKIIGLIPARYESSRFPGKPLALIAGKSMIQRTWEQAQKISSLSEVAVATDDPRIVDHVTGFGGRALLTSHHHETGTERLAEAAEHFLEADLIVNLQGDEPGIDPAVVEQVIEALIHDREAAMSTAVCPLKPEEAPSPSIVKCVFDKESRALYFSRSLIPGNKQGTFDPKTTYWRHLGLYVYRRDFLLLLPKLHSSLAKSEDLEQLKALENGYKIHVVPIKSPLAPGVDLPEDIEKFENYLCQQNSCS